MVPLQQRDNRWPSWGQTVKTLSTVNLTMWLQVVMAKRAGWRRLKRAATALPMRKPGRRSITFSALLLISLVIALASPARFIRHAALPAQTPPTGQATDQSCATPDTTPGGQVVMQNVDPVGQLFVPTQTTVGGFSIYINTVASVDNQGLPAPFPMTISILGGGINGPVVGSGTFTVPGGGFQSYWYTASFGPQYRSLRALSTPSSLASRVEFQKPDWVCSGTGAPTHTSSPGT